MKSIGRQIPCVLPIVFLLAIAASSQTETVLHSFAGGRDGGYPLSKLILDPQGNLYGLAVGDTRTAAGYGTVFKVAPGGRETVLYSFTEYSFVGGISGASELPVNLIPDAQGNLYGTTGYGGAEDNCCGEIFEVSPTGGENVVYAFPNINPSSPATPLARDAEGNLYGSAGDGSFGAIIKLTPNGTLTDLYSFNNSDGQGGFGGLIIDPQGNLYGTSGVGGSSQCSFGCGTVYELTATGKFQLLHSFSGPDGYYPNPDLIRDTTGNLYGTTRFGGSNAACTIGGGCGTVFEITASGTEIVLYSFGGGSDGLCPDVGLVRDRAGNLYGTTSLGGINSCFSGSCGVVFKLAPDGTQTVLHSFAGGADGANPNGALALDSKGNLYGTTLYDGAHGYGTVFKVTP